MTADEAAQHAANSPVAVAVNREAGPLALAAALWRECLKKLTASEPPSLLRPIPESSGELAQAIADHFVERRTELDALAAELVPTLADRLVAGVGWSGFRAHVDEEAVMRPFPGQEWRFHGLAYSFGGDAVDVTAAPSPPPTENLPSRTFAESFLETPPRDAALEALVDELNALLPEIL